MLRLILRGSPCIPTGTFRCAHRWITIIATVRPWNAILCTIKFVLSLDHQHIYASRKSLEIGEPLPLLLGYVQIDSFFRRGSHFELYAHTHTIHNTYIRITLQASIIHITSLYRDFLQFNLYTLRKYIYIISYNKYYNVLRIFNFSNGNLILNKERMKKYIII